MLRLQPAIACCQRLRYLSRTVVIFSPFRTARFKAGILDHNRQLRELFRLASTKK